MRAIVRLLRKQGRSGSFALAFRMR